VALPARLAGAPEPREAAVATLETLRLAHLADRMPDEVSLGEQQRTAISRALVRPSFLIAEEPTGRLDEELSTHVLTTLREVCAAAGTGVLLASHDPVVVAAADRVVRLSDGLVVEG
jgi:putative ABC transport system ATP-binding protein